MTLGDPDELRAGMRKTLAAESETGPGYTVSQHMEKGEWEGKRHRGSQGSLKKRE